MGLNWVIHHNNCPEVYLYFKFKTEFSLILGNRRIIKMNIEKETLKMTTIFEFEN
jgi:hypothetical protein